MDGIWRTLIVYFWTRNDALWPWIEMRSRLYTLLWIWASHFGYIYQTHFQSSGLEKQPRHPQGKLCERTGRLFCILYMYIYILNAFQGALILNEHKTVEIINDLIIFDLLCIKNKIKLIQNHILQTALSNTQSLWPDFQVLKKTTNKKNNVTKENKSTGYRCSGA